jgi:cold shock CspA family protein/ribosome-associated translation inhibitor RaiA
MQSQPQLEFEGFQASPEMRSVIDKHVAVLERYFGRITAARICVRGSSHHHRTGGQYQVSIRLSLPDGKEVNVERTPRMDDRYSDLSFALGDAFERTRRQLQEEARRMRGDVKEHGSGAVGIVVRIDPSGEFGFLKDADGQEIYFNRHSVLGAMSSIRPGSRVSYVEEMGEKGPQANTVRILGKHALRP